MDDHELLAAFREGRLDHFPHEDHLRVIGMLVETSRSTLRSPG